jgi:hypothetical protein
LSAVSNDEVAVGRGEYNKHMCVELWGVELKFIVVISHLNVMLWKVSSYLG